MLPAPTGRTGRGLHPPPGQADAYRDVVGEVSGELLAQVDAAVTAGVDPDRLILDPGLGFAKSAEHNWDLLRGLPTLIGLGFPVLVGASRKRFLGSLLRRRRGGPSPSGRETATAAVSALAAAAGVGRTGPRRRRQPRRRRRRSGVDWWTHYDGKRDRWLTGSNCVD